MILPMMSASLLLAGCGDSCCPPGSHSEHGSTNAPASATGTAPTDYLKNAAQSQQDAVKTIDTVALNKAIDLFRIQEGRLPNDLDELASKKFIPSIPFPPAGSKIVYDPQQGKVTVEKL